MTEDSKTEPQKPVVPAVLANPERAQVENTQSEQEPEGDTVVLVADLPFFVTAYEVPREDAPNLVFNANGTEVPADEADDLISNAALNGVSLNRKAN